MTPETIQLWRERQIKVAHLVFRQPENQEEIQGRRLLPQLFCAARHIVQLDMVTEEAIELMSRGGYFLHELGSCPPPMT